MNLREDAWQLPIRLSAGAFVLNSGLTKRSADEQTADQVHGFASGAYPFLKQLDPPTFIKLLSATEISLGAALLAPVVPASVAGLGLTAFAAGLMGLYLRTPGMRQPGSIRPTHEGIGMAKDVWLLAMGTSLVIGDLTKR